MCMMQYESYLVKYCQVKKMLFCLLSSYISFQNWKNTSFAPQSYTISENRTGSEEFVVKEKDRLLSSSCLQATRQKYQQKSPTAIRLEVLAGLSHKIVSLKECYLVHKLTLLNEAIRIIKIQ